MKPPAFSYHNPTRVDDAIQLLAADEDAKVLAGGQSLMPMLNLRLARPTALIDINGVHELGRIDWDAQPGSVRIGAMVRQRSAERDERLARTFPLIGEALGNVGHFQTRNRGTVGGSLAHLDPAAELVAVACAADAVIRVRSVDGIREIPYEGYPLGPLTPDIAPGELLVAVDIPLWAQGHGHAFVEFARRHGDFAIAAVAVLVEIDDAERISRCSIAVLGLGSAPLRAHTAEDATIGTRPDQQSIDMAVDALAKLTALRDAGADAAYRQQLARHLTSCALSRAIKRALAQREAS